MEIITCPVGPLGEYCYLLSAENSDRCVIIDPGAEPERIRKALGKKSVEAILLTHGHFDHIGAVRTLMDEGTRLFAHSLDAPMLKDSGLNAGLSMLGEDITAPEPTDFVHDEEVLHLAGLEFTVLHTPGHTPGSVCYLTDSDCFSGDTVFEHGWGRTDLPGGSNTDMMHSLRRVIPYLKTRALHPGHAD